MINNTTITIGSTKPSNIASNISNNSEGDNGVNGLSKVTKVAGNNNNKKDLPIHNSNVNRQGNPHGQVSNRNVGSSEVAPSSRINSAHNNINEQLIRVGSTRPKELSQAQSSSLTVGNCSVNVDNTATAINGITGTTTNGYQPGLLNSSDNVVSSNAIINYKVPVSVSGLPSGVTIKKIWTTGSNNLRRLNNSTNNSDLDLTVGSDGLPGVNLGAGNVIANGSSVTNTGNSFTGTVQFNARITGGWKDFYNANLVVHVELSNGQILIHDVKTSNYKITGKYSASYVPQFTGQATSSGTDLTIKDTMSYSDEFPHLINSNPPKSVTYTINSSVPGLTYSLSPNSNVKDGISINGNKVTLTGSAVKNLVSRVNDGKSMTIVASYNGSVIPCNFTLSLSNVDFGTTGVPVNSITMQPLVVNSSVGTTTAFTVQTNSTATATRNFYDTTSVTSFTNNIGSGATLKTLTYLQNAEFIIPRLVKDGVSMNTSFGFSAGLNKSMVNRTLPTGSALSELFTGSGCYTLQQLYTMYKNGQKLPNINYAINAGSVANGESKSISQTYSVTPIISSENGGGNELEVFTEIVPDNSTGYNNMKSEYNATSNNNNDAYLTSNSLIIIPTINSSNIIYNSAQKSISGLPTAVYDTPNMSIDGINNGTHSSFSVNAPTDWCSSGHQYKFGLACAFSGTGTSPNGVTDKQVLIKAGTSWTVTTNSPVSVEGPVYIENGSNKVKVNCSVSPDGKTITFSVPSDTYLDSSALGNGMMLSGAGIIANIKTRIPTSQLQMVFHSKDNGYKIWLKVNNTFYNGKEILTPSPSSNHNVSLTVNIPNVTQANAQAKISKIPKTGDISVTDQIINRDSTANKYFMVTGDLGKVNIANSYASQTNDNPLDSSIKSISGVSGNVYVLTGALTSQDKEILSAKGNLTADQVSYIKSNWSSVSANNLPKGVEAFATELTIGQENSSTISYSTSNNVSLGCTANTAFKYYNETAGIGAVSNVATSKYKPVHPAHVVDKSSVYVNTIYQSNNDVVSGSSHTEKGDVGTFIPLTKMPAKIPSGYHLVDILVNGKAKKLSEVTGMGISKTPVHYSWVIAKNIGKANVKVIIKGSTTPLSSKDLSGDEGSAISGDNYTPVKGYHLVDTTVNGKTVSNVDGLNYTSGTTDIVYTIEKDAPKIGKANVKVIIKGSTTPLSSKDLSGDQGSLITGDTYSAVNGYHLVSTTVNSKVATSVNGLKYESNVTNIVYTIEKSAPSVGTASVSVIIKGSTTPLSSKALNGDIDSNITGDNYVPVKGYHLVNTTVNGKTVTSINGLKYNVKKTSIVYTIEKDAPKTGDITVVVKTSDGTIVVPKKTITGNVGSTTNGDSYSTIKGYHLVNVSVNGKIVPSTDIPSIKIPDGTTNIIWTVAKDKPEAKPVIKPKTAVVKRIVEVVNSQGEVEKTLVNDVTIATGNVGSKVNIPSYKAPDHYRIISNSIPSSSITLTNNETQTIKVIKVVENGSIVVETKIGNDIVGVPSVISGKDGSVADIPGNINKKGYHISKILVNGKEVKDAPKTMNQDGSQSVTYILSPNTPVNVTETVNITNPITKKVTTVNNGVIYSGDKGSVYNWNYTNTIKGVTVTGITLNGSAIKDKDNITLDKDSHVVVNLTYNVGKIVSEVVDEQTGKIISNIVTTEGIVGDSAEPKIPAYDKGSYKLVKTLVNGKESKIPDSYVDGTTKIVYEVAKIVKDNIKVVDTNGKVFENNNVVGEKGTKIPGTDSVIPKGYEIVSITVNGKVVKTIPTELGDSNANIVITVKKKDTKITIKVEDNSTKKIFSGETIIGNEGKPIPKKDSIIPKGYKIVSITVNGKVVKEIPKVVPGSDTNIVIKIAKIIDIHSAIIKVEDSETGKVFSVNTLEGERGKVIPGTDYVIPKGYKVISMTVNGKEVTKLPSELGDSDLYIVIEVAKDTSIENPVPSPVVKHVINNTKTINNTTNITNDKTTNITLLGNKTKPCTKPVESKPIVSSNSKVNSSPTTAPLVQRPQEVSPVVQQPQEVSPVVQQPQEVSPVVQQPPKTLSNGTIIKSSSNRAALPDTGENPVSNSLGLGASIVGVLSTIFFFLKRRK